MYCLRYETGEQNDAASSGDAKVEVVFSNDADCKIEFLLNETKTKGVAQSKCRNVTCPYVTHPKDVKISQASDDGWSIESLEIQTYPESSDYFTYSFDGKITQFWVDGNNDGDYSNPACTDGEWCNLMRVDSGGNSLDISLRPYPILKKFKKTLCYFCN